MYFSIIIPIYKVEKYLRKCIESVINQTYKNIEIILVDDGSPDNCGKICDEYEKKDSRIKVIHKENGGLSSARNAGIDIATGDYIVFLDSDDYLDDCLLQELNEKINEHTDLELIRISNYTERDGTKEKEDISEKEFTGEELFLDLRKKRICIETAWTYVIKREYWNSNGFKFPEGKIHEDFGMMLIVILKAKRTYGLSNAYYHYIVRENSIMTNTSYESELKKSADKLKHYDYVLRELNKISDLAKKTRNICLEYITTVVCLGMKKLKDKDKENYKKELRKRKVLKNLKIVSIRSIAKKIIFAFRIYT